MPDGNEKFYFEHEKVLLVGPLDPASVALHVLKVLSRNRANQPGGVHANIFFLCVCRMGSATECYPIVLPLFLLGRTTSGIWEACCALHQSTMSAFA